MKNLMDYVRELNERLESEEVIQYDPGRWIFEQFEDFKCDSFEVMHTGTVEEHRWYGLQDLVFEVSLGDETVYLKNHLVTQLYSERMCWDDACYLVRPFEVVEPYKKTVTAYRPVGGGDMKVSLYTEDTGCESEHSEEELTYIELRIGETTLCLTRDKDYPGLFKVELHRGSLVETNRNFVGLVINEQAADVMDDLAAPFDFRYVLN